MENKERVELGGHEYPSFLYGGFSRRFIAFIVDLIVISAIYKLISIPLINLLEGALPAFFEKALYTIIYLLYFSLTTKLTNGQTLGKILFDLRVVCPGEEELSWSTVITREVLSRYILKRIVILYISVPFTRNNRHIGDFFANTYVVREDHLYEYRRMQDNPIC